MSHRHAPTLTSYADLTNLARDFVANEKRYSLILFGSPGLAKSVTFEAAMKGEDVVVIRGRLTAYKLYTTLKDHQDSLFVFDDTRAILKDAECINLLMSLGENRREKKIQWNTNSEEGNSEFTTRSRQAILINRLNSTEDIDPVLSRSNVYRFEPTKQEVHTYVGRWFPTTPDRKEIYDFIGKHLDLVEVPDIRDYVKTEAEMGMDWKRHLLESWKQDQPYAIAAMQVKNNLKLKTKQQKAMEFKRLCGGSVAQLYWWLKKFAK